MALLLVVFVGTTLPSGLGGEALVLSDAVAITTTGPDGRFSFAVSRADVDRLFAGRRPVVKLKVVSGTMLLADTQSSHTWHLRDHARGRIDVHPALPIGIVSAGPRLSVRGTLRDVVTGPMAGATVQAFDRNVTAEGVAEALLGSDTTDARSRFRIAFENRHLGRPGKEVPDLVVRAAQGGTTLAEAHACAALPITEIDLVRGGEVFLGRGEYAWLLEALDGLRGGASWRAISPQQAGLLSCSARVDRAAVDALAAAARLAFAVPAIPEEAFYGLLRHGLPTTSVALFSHRPIHLRKTLERAITSGTISHALGKQLGALEQAFEDACVLAPFDLRPSGVGLGTLVSHTPGVSSAAQHSFVRKVLQHTGDAASFWALLGLDPQLSSHVAPLQFWRGAVPCCSTAVPGPTGRVGSIGPGCLCVAPCRPCYGRLRPCARGGAWRGSDRRCDPRMGGALGVVSRITRARHDGPAARASRVARGTAWSAGSGARGFSMSGRQTCIGTIDRSPARSKLVPRPRCGPGRSDGWGRTIRCARTKTAAFRAGAPGR